MKCARAAAVVAAAVLVGLQMDRRLEHRNSFIASFKSGCSLSCANMTKNSLQENVFLHRCFSVAFV